MMLPVEGPKTTLMEDLQELGLAEAENKSTPAADNKKGKGYAKPDAEGGDFAGPPKCQEAPLDEPWGEVCVNTGDKAAGHFTNVPVGADRNVSPTGDFGKGRGGAKNEDDDEDTSDKMVPAFMIPTEEEVQEAEVQTQQEAEEDKLGKAWQVVHAYFGEDSDGLNEDGLRGVLNAMGFCLNTCVEDIANLTVENGRLSEAVTEMTNLLYETEKEEKDDDEEKDDEEKDDEEEAPKAKKSLPPWLMKKGAEESAPAANLQEDASLNSLLNEIREIGSESTSVQAIDKQAQLIEGFETARDSCREIVGRIVQVIGEDQGIGEDEEPELYEDDERVQLAQFFEGIANDAESYLARLSEGDVPFKVAEADIKKIFSDMEKGIEAMHTVE